MDWLDPISILFLSVFTTVFLFKMGSLWNSSNKGFPPGPRPLPFIGNLHIMDLKRPHTTMLKLSKVYGPVFSIQMGLQKIVVLTGYETVKEALVTQADGFAERPIIPMFEDIGKGFGVIFSHGENWKVMRRFTLTTLRDYGMGKRTIEDKIVEECSFLIKKLESYEGKPVETTRIMNAATANIIVSILLDKRYEYEDSTFLRLLQMANENIRLAGTPSVMEEKKNKTNGYFHTENLKSLVANLFAAGMDTTASTLLWGLLLMMKYPEIQRKVQEEIRTVVGSSQPRTEHRTKMPYTDAVIHELQRFASIVPANLPHATTVDVTLKGYFIPKGTHVLPLLISVLKDETQWEKPYKFYPEHFLDSEGKFVKRDAFMPFSAGRRICAGETLAKMELFLFFTSLLQRFTFQPAPGISKEDLDLTPAIGIVTPPVSFKLCALPHS
ncbi:cytochrome P450 2K4-like isoform X2 [Hemicordylus capensis]|uniref:cytochrome P450 2K4-like isoform X2 n=1 Tax=Hemicordylus capensis TaxID=884348 RepID=UPI002304879B|nr:cytochrome P450 2K4-like isoform X2 [Hemicordylus capensis]